MQNVIGIYNRGVYPIAAGGSYLLDTYTGSTVAYSLRKLSSSTTNVVRVRRSSDNAESDFSDTDITDGTLTTWTGANDGFVVTMYDQGGTNHMGQATAGSQPKLVSAGTVEVDPANGLPSMLFNGTNDYFSLTTGVNTTQLFYSSSVFHRSASGIHTLSLTTLALYPLNFTWYTDNKIYSGMGATALALTSANTSTGDFLISTLRDSSNNVKSWLNGSALTTGTLVDAGTTFTKFGLRGSITNYNNGYFQELIYWNSDQESNRTGIETDTNTYYSIY